MRWHVRRPPWSGYRQRRRGAFIKYQELAADLAVQNPGWKVSVVPVVIGDLGRMGKLRSKLTSMELFTKQQVNRLACEIQYETLCSAIRIVPRVMVHNEQ